MSVNVMYRSFASLRMTTKRNAVILTEGKDLYEMCTNNIQNLSPYLELMTMPPGLYHVRLIARCSARWLLNGYSPFFAFIFANTAVGRP